MSVHYIVDGYNAIRRLPAFDAAHLAESRQRLCAYLEGRRPHGSARNRVTVVFDGSARVGPAVRAPWPFDVLFSIGESADDVIRRLVREARQPKNCVVVTDDKGLASVVKESGAAVAPVSDFFKARPQGKVRGVRAREALEETSLDIVAREKITQELCRLWLKKK